MCLGAGLAQDAQTAQLDAAEASEARAYAPEVAEALTRRALPRAVAAAAALAGGAVAGGSIAVRATAPASTSQAHAAPVVAGLFLMLTAQLLQIWDTRSLSREVALANGTTPPGINAPSNAPVRAQAGLAAALALLAVAAAAAGAGRMALASLLADAVRLRCTASAPCCADAARFCAGRCRRRCFCAPVSQAGVARARRARGRRFRRLGPLRCTVDGLRRVPPTRVRNAPSGGPLLRCRWGRGGGSGRA